MLLRVRVADTASLLTLSERMLAAARVEGHDFDLLSKPVQPKDLINKLKGLVAEPSQSLWKMLSRRTPSTERYKDWPPVFQRGEPLALIPEPVLYPNEEAMAISGN